jgi:hypothetical protein
MRCSHCKKKSHLEFSCVCSGTFCVKCRTPEEHVCTAQTVRVETERKKLEETMQKVVADKIPERLV